MKRFEVIESKIAIGSCSKCGKSRKYGSVGVRVVGVLDLKRNREEWRCNNCVRWLSPQVAHRLTELELRELRSLGIV